MTIHDTWDDFDPVAPATTDPPPTAPGSMADVPLDPRLTALRDGTAAPTDGAARRRRISVMEAEAREYAQGIEEFGRLIEHMRAVEGVRAEILGVALSHLMDRRARVEAAYMRTIGNLDILRRGLPS